MAFRDKIHSPEALASLLDNLHKNGRLVVHAHGVFDLLHRGHLAQFEEARRQGDLLVVSVTTDAFVAKGPSRPVFPCAIRMEMIAALEMVDYVTFSDAPDATQLITLFRSDVYVKGRSYVSDASGRIILEQQALAAHGGRMHFAEEVSSDEDNGKFSSTKIYRTYINPYPEHVASFLEQFKRAHPLDEVLAAVRSLQNLRVLVLGEAIIDSYCYSEPMNLSPKGSVVALKHISQELFAGGSLAGANHIANYCDTVHVVASIGSVDSHEPFIAERLAPNVRPHFLRRQGFPTIVKQRRLDLTYLHKHTETYFMRDDPLCSEEESSLIATLDGLMNETDVVVVLDYGHGLITPRVVEYLVARAPFLAVNTQTNSANKGFHVISRYPHVDFVCIDHGELRLDARDKITPIPELARTLKNKLTAGTVAITLGHNGSLVIGGESEAVTPIIARQVVDTIGAGDAFFSIAAPCVASNVPPDVTGFLGNAVGALAITYVGNKLSVTKPMLFELLNSVLA